MSFPYTSLLLAQESTPAAAPAAAPAREGAGDGEEASSGPGGMGMMPFFIGMFVIMYFVMIRPQQKRAKEHRKRIESLKIGSKVISAGGIHGLVTNVSDKTVTVKVSDNSKIKFEKASISQVFSDDKDAPAADDAPMLPVDIDASKIETKG